MTRSNEVKQKGETDQDSGPALTNEQTQFAMALGNMLANIKYQEVIGQKHSPEERRDSRDSDGITSS